MGAIATRTVRYIRKGDDGKDAVRLWLVASTTSVSMPGAGVAGGSPVPASVSCAVMKQIGDSAPIEVADPAAEGLVLRFYYQRADGRQTFSVTYGGPVNISDNELYRSLNFELYSGSVMISTFTVALVRDGAVGTPGDAGKDAVVYSLVPSATSIVMTGYNGSDGRPVPEKVSCKVMKQSGEDEPIEIDVDAEGLEIRRRFTYTDGSLNNEVSYDGNDVAISTRAVFKLLEFLLYRDDVLISSATIPIMFDGTPGTRGDRGPALRGPQAWSDCADGYSFQCGADGEMWQDVVIYQNRYYSCKKSHAKSADNAPRSSADISNGYWQLAAEMDIVATKILLSTYALVKNLGVECIDMRDAVGNILFQAKDGNVTCKTGSFEDVKVSGDIRVKSLRHVVNPSDNVVTSAFWCSTLMDSLSLGTSGARVEPYIVFPHLAPGEAMETTVVHFPNQAYCDIHNEPAGLIYCVGEGYDYHNDEWDGVVAFLTKREMTAEISRAGGISGIDPTPPKPGGDIYEVVSNRYYGAEAQCMLPIRGVWKFYGVGLDWMVELPDGTMKNATLWVAIELQSA